MNKNTIIGLLVLVVVLGGGYYLMKGDKATTYNSINTPITQVNNGTTKPITASTPSAPSVETSKNYFSSSSTASLTGTVKPNGAPTTYWFEYGESTSLVSRSVDQAIGGGYSAIPATGFITGLRANTTYNYRLNAKNKFGTVNGALFTLQTNNTNPPKVSAPTVRTNNALNVERTTATIKGEVNPNGSATSYWFEYGTDNGFGDVTTYQATNSGSTFMPVSGAISGLAPLTKYYFRLNGQNQFGTINGPTMNFTTDGPALSSKPTVEVSSATAITASSAMLAGQVDPNGAETTYWFEYSTDSLLGNIIGSGTAKKTVNGTNPQNVQMKVDSLNPDTKYYYHLVAKSEHGTVYSESASFTTKKK
jgi:hypothetical protein